MNLFIYEEVVVVVVVVDDEDDEEEVSLMNGVDVALS